jgi:radical SAM protein (TIGR04043 family)
MEMETRALKVDLLCLGARVAGMIKGRKAGAGPAGGGMFIIGDTVANVATQSWFVAQSPYHLEFANGRYQLRKNNEFVTEVRFPTAQFQTLKTAEGIPYYKIALLHGMDCLATTTIQTCVYWNTPLRCRFCAIELSLQSGATIAKKTPEQLAEVARAAMRLDLVTHVTLTTGTTATPDKGIEHLVTVARAIKAATGLPIHVQFEPPKDLTIIDRLADTVDTVGIHVESFDKGVQRAITPCKADIPLEQYIEAWKRSVALFGESQVSSFVLAGLGEKDESIIEGSRLLAELGVYPFIVPLRPIAGSMLEHERPPSPERMAPLYEAVAEILRETGVSWRKCKAGCVKCRACSALPEYE